MISFLTSASAPWGAENSLVQIILGLAELGIDSRVLTCGPSVAEFAKGHGLSNVVRIEEPRGSRLSRTSVFLRAVRGFPDSGPVVIFSPNLYSLAPVLRGMGRSVVLDLHDDFGTLRSRVSLRVWLMLAEGGIAISEFVRAQAPRRSRCIIVPRPIMPIEGSPPAGYGDVHDVAIIGRLVPEKRIELAIEAVADIPEVRLHIFGEPFGGSEWYRSRLERQASLMAPERVIFHGRRDPEDIYHQVGVVLVANPREASGRTVGEAMLAGRVALVPSEGGSREFVEPGSTGFVWDASKGSDGIARALRSILSQPDLGSVVRAGRRSILEERSTGVVAVRYAQALDALTWGEPYAARR